MTYKKTKTDLFFDMMGLFGATLLTLAVTAHFLLGNDNPPDPQITITGTIVRVVDGDTVDVEIKSVVRVRLLDCWAPESKIDNRVPKEKQLQVKELGLKSKQNLANLCLNKKVTLSIPLDKESHLTKSLTLDRMLGRVWVDGDSKSLSERQVESGNATYSK